MIKAMMAMVIALSTPTQEHPATLLTLILPAASRSVGGSNKILKTKNPNKSSGLLNYLLKCILLSLYNCLKYGSRRSPTIKSSASLTAYSWFFRSTPRTQTPSDFRRLTKCPPMNPPAPQTTTFSPLNFIANEELPSYRRPRAAREKMIACEDNRTAFVSVADSAAQSSLQ